MPRAGVPPKNSNARIELYQLKLSGAIIANANLNVFSLIIAPILESETHRLTTPRTEKSNQCCPPAFGFNARCHIIFSAGLAPFAVALLIARNASHHIGHKHRATGCAVAEAEPKQLNQLLTVNKGWG